MASNYQVTKLEGLQMALSQRLNASNSLVVRASGRTTRTIKSAEEYRKKFPDRNVHIMVGNPSQAEAIRRITEIPVVTLTKKDSLKGLRTKLFPDHTVYEQLLWKFLSEVQEILSIVYFR